MRAEDGPPDERPESRVDGSDRTQHPYPQRRFDVNNIRAG